MIGTLLYTMEQEHYTYRVHKWETRYHNTQQQAYTTTKHLHCECHTRHDSVIYIYTIALTCNLRLGFYPGEILRPERGYRASELKVGGVATVGMEVGGSIVDNLLRLNLIGHLSLVVGTSFEETGPGKLL